MATVWVYPEREFRQLGAVRWLVTWETVKASAAGKAEIDHDTDIVHHACAYRDKASALTKARSIVDAGRTAYGAATVTKQVVDWFVEEDRIAEWADTDEREEVS